MIEENRCPRCKKPSVSKDVSGSWVKPFCTVRCAARFGLYCYQHGLGDE
jgi:endogenous inhibitor of DNA gyrase (YacG/DUF329 family)